jgi:hypothetical protein
MARRKKKENDLLETVGIKLHPSVIAELDAIADNTITSRSWAGRRLLLIGLEIYHRNRSLILDNQTYSPPVKPSEEPGKRRKAT